MFCSGVTPNSFAFIFFVTVSWESLFVGSVISGLPEMQYPVEPEVDQVSENMIQLKHHRPKPPPNRPPHPFIHAGLPRKLAAYPIPRSGSDHQLQLNVTWMPSYGPRAREYSLEVVSVTQTAECVTPMCYEYNIPGDTVSFLVPSITNPVSETCTIRPGCAYRVRLVPHPWDGHTAAQTLIQLDECVSGVCSCAYASYLPKPTVTATTVIVDGAMAANVTWSLPTPQHPQTLPTHLDKAYYVVSIGKQMVSDAHPAPWFAITVSRRIDSNGSVLTGDSPRSTYIPIGERTGKAERKVLDVRLLARVNLVDSRRCIGPAGNATAYDPVNAHKAHLGAYAAWAAFGGLFVLALVVVLAVSTRVAKRAIKAVLPFNAPAPTLRPVWLSMQLRTNAEASVPRCQVEESPLYVQKDYESDEEEGDEWEVRRSKVQLGGLIGSGAFGRVYAATLHMPHGEAITVAAKMLSDTASQDEQQDFLREIAMLKHVGTHKHVIQLIGCCTTKAPLIALLEHAPRGDLLSLLRAARDRRDKKEDKREIVRDNTDSGNSSDMGIRGRPSEGDSEYTNISDDDPALPDKPHQECVQHSKDHYVAEPTLRVDSSTMREYALQVALGMRHLEDRGITHRDLAARNILVDASGVLKVADFGLSRTGVYVHTRARPVPLRWLAPEAILHAKYCTASDVWAFAVLLWEIATLGGFPYAELSNQHVPAYLSTGRRLPRPARASPRLYRLMLDCWNEDPAQRPTFAEIVRKLNAQTLLYVELDSILPEEPMDDGEVFTEGNSRDAIHDYG